MESDSSVSALSGSSASRKSRRGRRRGHLASKSSAPTQAKLVALASNGVPEPVGVLEEAFSSLEDARAATSSAAIDAAPPAAVPAVDLTVAPAVSTAAKIAATTATAATAAARAGQTAMMAELSATQRMVRSSFRSLGSVDTEELSCAISRYDELVMALMLRCGELETRLAMPPPPPPPSKANTTAANAPQMPQVAPIAAPRTTKVRETWSAVVKCDDPALSGKAIAEKVRTMVAPSLGVRVHEVRELRRGGGAIIRTPSVGELQKVMASKRFAEVGLNVARNAAEKPKVVVYDVDTAIGPEEFMQELHENNFDSEMTLAQFKKSVHLVTKAWSATDGATVNVTLEVDDRAMAKLDVGRVYIKWFSFRCRSQVRTYACHRCVGFDHKVSECRQKDSVCRQCGQQGHTAAKCQNPVDCRNCRHRGQPSGHYMLSNACPIYGALLARVQARH